MQHCSIIIGARNESPESRSQEPHVKTKRSKTNIPVHIQKTMNTMHSLKEEVLQSEKEDVFSHFAKNIACQLRTLSLIDALECQTDILNIIQKKRIASLKTSASSTSNEYLLEEPCDGGNNDYDIVMMENKRFKTSFHVARVYYAPIIGTKGQTKKRLEDETKTLIKVPRQPHEHEVVIIGSRREAVASARRRVEMIVLAYKKKQQFTHFLSIPMTSPTVKENFNEFQQLVLRDCKVRGVDETIFQNPDKLHLTLCTLVLNDEVERSEATQILEACKKDIIDPLMDGYCITILLSGIEYMNDDPSEVDVLYAKVHTNDILNDLIGQIVDYCSNSGIVEKQYESVKLHVTIMNTKFRTKPDINGKSKPRETFNSKPILEKFKNYEFGEVTIDTIHLSTRYSTSKTDGYYQPTTTVTLLL